MNFRFCIPRVGKGTGGAGLGNELIAYAKGFIASKALNYNLLHPAWGLNKRGYYKYFRTSPLDWLGYEIMGLCLPTVTFTHEDYLRTGKKDYEEAIRIFAEENNLYSPKAMILYTEGMWAGTYEIKKAFSFIQKQLYQAKGAVKNLSELNSKIEAGKIRIAVHIRRGDFKKNDDSKDISGVFNTTLPIDWYINVCVNLRNIFGSSALFILLTDDPGDNVREFIKVINPLMTTHQKYRDCSDLLIAANADILVCSVSSFSIWGALLSGKPYIWYRPQLINREGYFFIWPENAAYYVSKAKEKYGLTMKENFTAKDRYVRGLPLDRDGKLFPYHIDCLLNSKGQYAGEFDLVTHGAIPEQIIGRW